MSNYPTTNISNPGPHDILCGRGGGTNAHPGNIKFRKLVAAHKLRYLAASKSDKPGVAREVVKEWRSLNPPGRFLAKMDDGCDKDDSRDIPTLWYDVGDKKAREKASQCLRERNGAANEAVQALVKTVTANGEACPEDYATLMNKAAMVKARNDVALQQQKEMLAQMSQMADINGGGFGSGMGNMEPQPYGLSENMLNEYSSRGSDNGGVFNDYGNRRNNNNGGGFGSGNNFQKYDQFNQNSNRNNNNYGNQMNDYQTEDELIEAEIKRMLAQKQAQMRMQNQGMNNMGMGNMGMGNMGGNNRGMGGCGMNRGGFGSDTQPYMGEESIMNEYKQLMQKQHQMNMGGMGNMNGMNGGFNGMGGMGSMNNQMNMQGNMGDSEDWIWNMANGRSNNMGNMMGNMGSNSMGFNNNNDYGMGNNSGRMQNNGNDLSPNNDAARAMLNRLRGMRKGGNPDSAYSGGGNDNMMNGMMNNQSGNGMMGNQGGSGGRGFTIEEYQASLQEFLANDGDGGNFNNKSRKSNPQDDGNYKNNGNNYGNGNDFKNNNGGNTKYGECVNVYQVPTSLGDKEKSTRGGRDSMQSIGTFGGFQSVDSNFNRKSFESVDDMDVRPTFRSVDTMDMMSITNSVNDIVDDDVLRNPETREKYEKKISSENSGYHKFEVQTLEVKTMEHGQGGGSGPKKIKKSIDPRLVAMSGTRQSVQTKETDGPSARRSSVASVDSRMSFGNM